jgi:radical SAM protein with 4Fe4S-binding SPASM domain
MNKKNNIITYNDPLIFRKKKQIDETVLLTEEGFPMPSVVEISESGMCNRKCVFCPRSDPDYNHVNEFISPKLVDKLTKQLSSLDYENLILFSGFVEPLLDKNIYNLIKIVKKNLPKSNIEIITNGDVLNKKRLLKLYESGLTCLLVSVYDGKEAEDKLLKLMKDAGLKDHQYKLRKRYLSEKESFGISMSNRGGMMANAAYAIKNPETSLKRPCFYPNYIFFMDYNGDVIICNHDWGKKMIIGNMLEKSFKEIWLDEKWLKARKNLYEGNRDFLPCKNCLVDGLRMGSMHARAWKDYDDNR